MKLKLLYTGCLLLCLSTIASSNECLRYCHHAAAGKIVISGVSAAASDQAPTLIKLLYI